MGFKNAVLQVGEKLSPNTGGYFRIDFGAQSTTAKVAFGKLKMAAHVFKNSDGGITVKGIAKDAYNFEFWNTNYTVDYTDMDKITLALNNDFITTINNMAYVLQRTGFLHPFKYGVQINTVVYK